MTQRRYVCAGCAAHDEQWGSVRHFCHRYLCACYKAKCERRARMAFRKVNLHGKNAR